MKKILLFAIAMVMAFTVSAQEKQIIEIAEKTYDFGVIKEEDGRVTHVFTFKNVTEGPLTIKNVRASCGCTTPAWSREPIAPNTEAQITVTYNNTTIHKTLRWALAGCITKLMSIN